MEINLVCHLKPNLTCDIIEVTRHSILVAVLLGSPDVFGDDVANNNSKSCDVQLLQARRGRVGDKTQCWRIVTPAMHPSQLTSFAM